MPIVPITKSRFLKLKRILQWLLERLRNYKSVYVTEKHRPVFCSKYFSFHEDRSEDTAIMLQGPIVKENDFTYETIKLYQNNFPNAKIILSTWRNESIRSDILNLRNLIIVKDLPYEGGKGHGSTNYQIKGNKNGLKKIIDLKIPYTLKTRTDQRLSNPDNLTFLKSMLNLFPIKDNLNQKDRLIGMSFDTFLYRLYGLSDMFLFGRTEDVFSYFNCKYDTRTYKNYKINVETQRLYSQENLCEVYFMTEFLKKKGVKVNWTLKQSLNELKKRFLIVDSYSLDFFWPKYSFIEDRWRNYKSGINKEEITFSKWLRIYNSDLEINEKILDLKLNE